MVTDNPLLTVRLDEFRGRPPLRVVVDGLGRTPHHAAVLDSAAPTLIATTPVAPVEVRREWEAAGAEVVLMENGQNASFPLSKLVELLGKRDVQDVLIEGGSTLVWGVVEAGLADRLILYLAPQLIGGDEAPGIMGGAGVPNIAEAIRLTVVEVTQVGADLKVVADVHGNR